VPDEPPDALLIEVGAEELSVSSLESRKVENKSAGATVANLHRGEMAEAGGRLPQRLRADVLSVELDAEHLSVRIRVQRDRRGRG
jgi:hypothetical protein